MKRILLILGLCLVSLLASAGKPVIYYVYLHEGGVAPTNLADYTYVAELADNPGDRVVPGENANCAIVALPDGKVYVKIDAQRFDNPFVKGAQINITVNQLSTGKVAMQTITVSLVTGAEYFRGDKGIDIGAGEAPKEISISLDKNTLALCEGDASQFVTATVKDAGAGGYTITWPTGITGGTGANANKGTINPAALGVGVHTLTVTVKDKDLGKTATTTVTVTVKAKPVTPRLNSPAPVFAGDSVTLKVENSAAYTNNPTYNWSGSPKPASNPSATYTHTAKTTYTVSVTQDGCQSDPASQLVDIKTIKLTISPVTMCEGEIGKTITADVVGSTNFTLSGPAGVTWSGTTGTIDPTQFPAKSGAYTGQVTVTDAGGIGKNTANINLTVNGKPARPVINGPSSAIAGSDIALNVTNSYGSGATYNWIDTPKNGQGTASTKYTHNGERTYWVVVTDKCVSDTGKITVGVDGLGMTIDPVEICEGASGEFVAKVTGSSNYTITWSNPGITTTGGNKGTITTSAFPASGSPYNMTATVEDNITHKTLDVPILLTVNPLPKKPLLASQEAVCVGADITLQVTNISDYANPTFIWSPTPKTPSTSSSANYTHNAPTDYKVTVKDKNCEMISAILPVGIMTLNITLTPSASSITLGDKVTLTAGGDAVDSYVWADPISATTPGTEKTKDHTPGSAGEITYKVTGKKGSCTAVATAKVTVTEVVASELLVTAKTQYVAPATDICAGSSVGVQATVSGGTPKYTYSWSSLNPRLTFSGATDGSTATVNVAPDMPAGSYDVQVLVRDSKGQQKVGVTQINVRAQITLDMVNAVCIPDATTTYNAEITVAGGNGGTYGIYSNSAATTPVPGATWNGTTVTVPSLSTNKTFYIKEQPNGCNVLVASVEKVDCKCGAQLVAKLSSQDKPVCADAGEDVVVTFQASGGVRFSFDVISERGENVLSVVNEAKTEWILSVPYEKRGDYRIENFVAETATGTCDGNVIPKIVKVTFLPTPIVNAGKDITICGNDLTMVTLKGSGAAGLNFVWDNGVNDGVPFHPAVGIPMTYTVTGTDANGCTGTDDVQVMINPKPRVTAMAVPGEICKGEAVTLTSTATDGAVVTWNGGGVEGGGNRPTSSLTYLATGTIAGTGCSDTASAKVTVKQPVEISKTSNPIRNMAIGGKISHWVETTGNNPSFEWYRWNGADWEFLTDNAAAVPAISGSNTREITFTNVPRDWNGTKIKCVAKGDCDPTDEAEFTFNVKECFDIDGSITMGEGITPDQVPGDAVDGWFCIGNKVTLNAHISKTENDGIPMEGAYYHWMVDGELQGNVDIHSNTLSWIPNNVYEKDIVVRVWIYCDGACDSVSRKVRLVARDYDDIQMKLVVDPDSAFCPGEIVTLAVAVSPKIEKDRAEAFLWYNDIFDLQKPSDVAKMKNEVIEKDRGLLRLKMGQEDSWVRVVMKPSKEVCVRDTISDYIYLKMKKMINPTFTIVNDINDTIACLGDVINFTAVWDGAGDFPTFQWNQDGWNRGTGKTAEITIKDSRDVWVHCTMMPGKDVCYSGDTLERHMKISVMPNDGTVTITADMKNKKPGDELVFVPEVANVIGNYQYEWYVNGMMAPEKEKEYISSVLKQGDVIRCAIIGDRICQNRIFSNELTVDYGQTERDTMIDIYKGEEIRNLSLFRSGDENFRFFITEYPRNGKSSIHPVTGMFDYTPDKDFVGSVYVKYVVRQKNDKDKFEEGYVWINVKEGGLDELPNIVTPDGNGWNDVWDLSVITENYANYVITVYNRAGNVVFQVKDNYNNDWDGQGKGNGNYYMSGTHLTSGIYTYVIDLNNGQRRLISWLEIRAPFNRSHLR